MQVAEITNNVLIIAAIIGITMFLVQLSLAAVMMIVLRIASKERAEQNKEIFGLVKRIEGLTAQRREQMLQHYDRLLESLSNRLPVMVAGQASTKIVEAETQILRRLTELDPALQKDKASRDKLSELIRSMEGLEDTIVNLTAEAVRDIMGEGRRELLEDEAFFGSKAA